MWLIGRVPPTLPLLPMINGHISTDRVTRRETTSRRNVIAPKCKLHSPALSAVQKKHFYHLRSMAQLQSRKKEHSTKSSLRHSIPSLSRLEAWIRRSDKQTATPGQVGGSFQLQETTGTADWPARNGHIAVPQQQQPAGPAVSSPGSKYAALLAMLPAVYENNFHASRVMKVPDDDRYKAFYDAVDGIQRRVANAIQSKDSDSFNRVEYVMGGFSSDQSKWKPYIVISCKTDRDQPTIAAKLAKLPDIMKGYVYTVQADEGRLSSGATSHAVARKTTVVKAKITGKVETLCGMSCRIDAYSRTFTLGGMICVNDSLFALSTAHTFVNEAETTKAEIRSNGELLPKQIKSMNALGIF